MNRNACMARSTAEALFKKNSKLESFLKKSMNDETFERVRAYESFIVVSEKENKAFKYAVLGDEWIYLTENPPKTVVEEVSLKDIVSVDLVSENYFNINLYYLPLSVHGVTFTQIYPNTASNYIILRCFMNN